MSRFTAYQDSRLNVVYGEDHMLGKFYQIFDREMQDETEEGEGLVFDWSERFGLGVREIIKEYISQCAIGDNPDYVMTFNLN
jgi:hypothetical protein